MKTFACFGKKLQHLRSGSTMSIDSLRSSLCGLLLCLYQSIVYTMNPFWIQLCYFVSFSFLGFLFLKLLEPKTAGSAFEPKAIDMFFMSVSATTVSSMSTVEMEVFSNAQLVALTILMLLGGEVFISALGLQFIKRKIRRQHDRIDSNIYEANKENVQEPRNYAADQFEMGLESVNIELIENKKSDHQLVKNNEINHESSLIDNDEDLMMKYNSIRYLGYVALGYVLVVLLGGSSLVAVYISLSPSATEVLKSKGLHLQTFCVFTTVSTFTNCGFIPTNENMIVFKKNSLLLLLLIPQVLLGNTLYPSCLRLVIWVLGRFTKRVEFSYMLKHTKEMGYANFLPRLHSLFLFFTVVGFILVQFILFCSMEWNSEILGGLNSYQKIMAALFQVVNSRHAGESITDLSIISPAILVLFVLMMYLPPYTSFLPMKDGRKLQKSGDEKMKNKKKREHIPLDKLLFSQLSYLLVFVVLICITERKKLKDDPLNFNVLNIVIEVVSAYGNVGFTTGYSCKRQILKDESNVCKDTWYGFSGRWSNKGKLILIFVMLFGRLKKFNMNGGSSWDLS